MLFPHKQHFIAELSAQGMRIVLSVDAIGDPLGLAKDVTEGLSNLLQGNVPDMILNVTHGVTETVGKVNAPCWLASLLAC